MRGEGGGDGFRFRIALHLLNWIFLDINTTHITCLCKIRPEKTFLFLYKTTYMKNKIQLTDAFSELRTTKLNVKRSVFQMKDKTKAVV